MTLPRARRGPSHGPRRAIPALLLGAALVAAVGCARREPRAHTVAMRGFAFQPETLTVAQGDTVVWTNEDVVPHTATARDSTWDSGSVPSAATWRLVADRPGVRSYYCVFHPNMRGSIEVR